MADRVEPGTDASGGSVIAPRPATTVASFTGRGGRAITVLLAVTVVAGGVFVVIGPLGGSNAALGVAILSTVVLGMRTATDRTSLTVDGTGIHQEIDATETGITWPDLERIEIGARGGPPQAVRRGGDRMDLVSLRHERWAAAEIDRQRTRHEQLPPTTVSWGGRQGNAWLPADTAGKVLAAVAMLALVFAVSGMQGPAMRYPYPELRDLADRITDHRPYRPCGGDGHLGGDAASNWHGNDVWAGDAQIDWLTGRVRVHLLTSPVHGTLTARQRDMLEPMPLMFTVGGVCP